MQTAIALLISIPTYHSIISENPKKYNPRFFARKIQQKRARRARSARHAPKMQSERRKLVFERECCKLPVIARPVRTLVVAIPRLERKRTEKIPKEWAPLRFLAVIVTWFLSTGGLPHQCAHWFAMTAFIRQTPIILVHRAFHSRTPTASMMAWIIARGYSLQG